MRYAWYGTVPRFLIECMGWLLASYVTCSSFSSARCVFFPSAVSRSEGGRRKYTTTAGQVWVCQGSRSPGGILTLSTRTYAFSRATVMLGSCSLTGSVSGKAAAGAGWQSVFFSSISRLCRLLSALTYPLAGPPSDHRILTSFQGSLTPDVCSKNTLGHKCV